MTRIIRIAGVITALIVIALVALAVALSHDSAPDAAAPIPGDALRMKAIVRRQYGPPDVLKLEDIARPRPAHDEVLAKVHAAALNPLDWHFMRGKPYIVRLQLGFGRPKYLRLGVDFAGTVEAVGKDVAKFKVGDEIFGTADGAFSEYATSTEVGLALKPTSMSFQQAASVPVAALTALQGLRDKGQLKAGQKVLINGASGGVGTFAVQIAKALGAEVTGVCSTRNVAMVRSIGADHAIDYTREDYLNGAQRYDVIIDTVGNRPIRDHRQILTPKGTYVIVGGPNGGPWLGALTRFLNGRIVALFMSQKVVSFLADTGNTDDLNTLRELMQQGKLTPVIDRQYPLAEVPEAMRYLELGHARGKLVINTD